MVADFNQDTVLALEIKQAMKEDPNSFN